MANKEWHSLLERKLSRRSWLKLSAAAAGAALFPIQITRGESLDNTAVATNDAEASRRLPPFRPIRPSTADELLLPRGYSYTIIRSYGDRIADNQTFGFNNDYIAFFPINALEKGFDHKRHSQFFYGRGVSSSDGLLSVNHEYTNPLFVHGYTGGPKSQAQIDAEKGSVGLSIFRVQRGKDGRWRFVEDPLNRRINAWTMARFTGPAAGSAALFGSMVAMGSVGNCAGGTTPWGTVLSCEENVDEFALPPDKPFGMGWDSSYTKEHQGWVLEVDPYNPATMPRKHTAMGRFRHENATLVIGNSGKVVVYMGDDKADSCVYKFISAGSFQPGTREANMALLESGSLYAADFSAGKWRLLDYDKVEALRSAKKTDGTALFREQADVLANAPAAALTVKATPVDRPEDIEVHPKTRHVYVALTNNTGHGNFHGQIVRIEEQGDDPESLDFNWHLFAVGGPQSGFSSPDNLIFDPYGNLWMVTDISTSQIGKGIYSFQGNNAMFFFATEGPTAGKAVQFASGPVQSELTGMCWTPDGKTMFLSIQHPGEDSTGYDNMTSTWPRLPGDSIPRPSVVAINGFPGWR